MQLSLISRNFNTNPLKRTENAWQYLMKEVINTGIGGSENLEHCEGRNLGPFSKFLKEYIAITQAYMQRKSSCDNKGKVIPYRACAGIEGRRCYDSNIFGTRH
jgi:hypothetical protein